MQRAGQREVVDVVTGLLRDRALLSPSGHAGVDEARIDCAAGLGPKPEPLRHAGSIALDQRIGLGHELQHRRDRSGLLEVERERTFVAVVEVVTRRRFRLGARARKPIDAHHVGAEIAEQSPGERRRTYGAEFDDPKSLQRSAHALLP